MSRHKVPFLKTLSYFVFLVPNIGDLNPKSPLECAVGSRVDWIRCDFVLVEDRRSVSLSSSGQLRMFSAPSDVTMKPCIYCL